MRTIEKILPYVLSDNQVEYLTLAGIINGIWWSGNNIEAFIMQVITLFFWFEKEKGEKLLLDIRQLSYIHDIEYFFKLWFYKANYRFACNLFQLLHWCKLRHRVYISIFTLYILNKKWKKFYY